MYLSHYNIVQKPFQISPNPKFLWLGEKHKEALAMMEYTILNNQGFLVLTGDVGTGKTTLINALINSLGNDVLVATIFNPRLGIQEFFDHIGTNFNIKRKFNGKLDFIEKLSEFLHNAHNNKKTVLLIIDESQNLSGELLEEIRLLSNIEKEGSKLINIFFVGQSEFNDILMKKECRALRQRITTTYNIQPLREGETREYIAHRLNIAGCEGEIFTRKAIREIHSFSRGYPRLINIICDQALLTGYVKETKGIKHPIIRECARELSLPGEWPDSRQEAAAAIKKKRKVSLGRIALYASLLAVTTLTGYLLASTPQDDYINNFKTYYGQLFRAPEIPRITHSFQNKEIRKAVSVKKLSVLPARAVDRHYKQASEVVNHTENPTGISKSNFPTGGVQDISPDDLKLMIAFDYNTNEIPSETYKSLDKIAAIMLHDQSIEISVRGYTDALGRHGYNRKLSMFRANIVKSYLVGKGINPRRIRAIGMGEENPLRPNTTAKGRKANRRVEIELALERDQ